MSTKHGYSEADRWEQEFGPTQEQEQLAHEIHLIDQVIHLLKTKGEIDLANTLEATLDKLYPTE